MRQTERTSPRYAGIDTWPDQDMLAALWDGQMAAVAAVRSALPALAAAVPLVADRLRDGGGRIIYAGAGSSALLSCQDGMELPGTFGWPRERLLFLAAGFDADNLALYGGPEDDVDQARADAQRHAYDKDDVVVGVTASGSTPYTLETVRAAKAVGALTVGIANNPDTPLLREADLPICAETGTEVLSGSTRLGAGTAQKALLGMFSTAVMTRLGHVVDGMMVSVVADNAKLRKRAAQIVVRLAGCSLETADQALGATDGHVKPAVLVALGSNPAAASALLDKTGGDLRAAMTRSHEERQTKP